MTTSELIQRLSEFPPNAEVAILDSFNGAGSPRTINFGPAERLVRFDPDCDDINTPIGDSIVVIGYGCY
jgi:hypothetical protein